MTKLTQTEKNMVEMASELVDIIATMTAEKVATIFDAPCFMVVCPGCKKASKLDDAIERDVEWSSPCLKVTCPHCKLEATL